MDNTSNIGNRSRSLLRLAFDYNQRDSILSGFSELACYSTGSLYSQINLIDENNQWAVASCGMKFPHIANEESICFTTVSKETVYEIKDFTKHKKFRSHPLVVNKPYLKYYIGFPFSDDKGVVIGSICILHTEEISLSDSQMKMFSVIRQQISDYLTQKKEIQKNKELITLQKDQMTKILHDVRGPLSGIIGFADLLKLDTSDQTLLNKIDLIEQSAKDLHEYAEKSLKESQDKTEGKIHRTNVKTVVKKIKSLYAMQSALKNISLDFKVTLNKATKITGIATNDAVNVVGNVVSNAIKFSSNDDTITITISESSDFIEIIVSDNGEGIPSSILEQLNNLNYKKESSDKDYKNGFGIGLTEALNLFTQKNGKFHIDSTLGNGTQVALLFPKITDSKD